MNQDCEKRVKDFTDNQRHAFRACMKFISAGEEYQASKGALVSAIRSSKAYERKKDAVKVLKMLLKNPNTPLETVSGDKVVREDIEKEVAAK